MNIHVTEEIRKKYPQYDFRGKHREMKGRIVIEAYNPTTNITCFYSFEEDFFWMSGQIPDYKLKVENEGVN
jgi:hypothetical protein